MRWGVRLPARRTTRSRSLRGRIPSIITDALKAPDGWQGDWTKAQPLPRRGEAESTHWCEARGGSLCVLLRQHRQPHHGAGMSSSCSVTPGAWKGDKTQTMQTSLCNSLFPARKRCSRGASLQGSRVREGLVATLTDERKSPSHGKREVRQSKRI